MKDAWDVIILFLIAAIVGAVLYMGVIVILKKSFNKSKTTPNVQAQSEAQKQSMRTDQLRREQEALMRDQRRQQEQMRRDTQQRIKDLKRY